MRSSLLPLQTRQTRWESAVSSESIILFDWYGNLIRQLLFALEDSIVETKKIVAHIGHTVVCYDRDSEISSALASLFIMS